MEVQSRRLFVTSHPMRRVFVFSLVVRFFHWINAGAILVLGVTGFIIGNPPAILASHEAYAGYWFGMVRYIHFVTAYIFLFNLIVRIYWMFAGNRFEKWNNFIPTGKNFVNEMWEVIKIDILLLRSKHIVSIGHNALAGFSYLFLFLLMIAQTITGFGLYEAMSDSWIASLFSWVVPLFGSDLEVRFWHHVFMWAFVLFTMVHIYLVFYHDYVEGRGEVSSMFGGWKFIEQSTIDENEYTDYNRKNNEQNKEREDPDSGDRESATG